MSYDIRLVNKKSSEVERAKFTPNREGTYCLTDDEVRDCEFNITYNYAPHFRKVLDTEKGIRVIYGMTAKESIPVLEKSISMLGDDVVEDYWQSTEGNAKESLKCLLEIAKSSNPDSVWEGD